MFLVVGVLRIRALLFEVAIRAPDSCKLSQLMHQGSDHDPPNPDPWAGEISRIPFSYRSDPYR